MAWTPSIGRRPISVKYQSGDLSFRVGEVGLDNLAVGFTMKASPPIPFRIEWADSQGNVTASWLAAHFNFPFDLARGAFMGAARRTCANRDYKLTWAGQPRATVAAQSKRSPISEKRGGNIPGSGLTRGVLPLVRPFLKKS